MSGNGFGGPVAAVGDKSVDVLIIGAGVLVFEGLKHILGEIGFTAIASADEAAAQELLKPAATAPRLIIVDSHDLQRDVGFCEMLRRRFALSRLVILSDDCTLEVVARGFSAGVDGYLAKSTPCEPMTEALKLVMMGEKFMPASAYGGLAGLRPAGDGQMWRAGPRGGRLSDREIEILGCVAQGEANKAIAWRLDITEATVKVHIKTILRKLNVSNRTQAAIWAVGRGLSRADNGRAPGNRRATALGTRREQAVGERVTARCGV
ncbi:transcriptional regulator [Polymorphobacter glacialis]|uniref:Transcriptional regulator n=1 Tax=Sandarakinorhabdus glacialis TaxID=1614636 RepID=A0A917EAH4_9SPHN|nr:response regulator transcription factor [Polymorphobacter glacialis]GGE19331.1 transcriptional regulator [Polymorphobacter glacialis]